MDFKEKLKNWDKDISDYNPWKNGKGEQLIVEFLNCLTQQNNDFSWIELNGKKYKPATRYIIPTHVQGDYENANLYQCLYNPGVADSIWELKDTNICEFIEQAKNKENYIKRMFQDYQNFSVEDVRNKVEDVRNKIVQKDNILHQEIKLILGEFSEKPDHQSLTEFVESECYYIKSYYNALLGERGEGKNLLDKAVNRLLEDWDNLEKYQGLRICNLELVPFASKKKEDITLSKVSKTFTDFTVSIILKRISNHLKGNSERPVFVFRSRKEWFERLNRFIKSEFEVKESFDIEKTDLLDYFYEFSSQNAVLSRNNIIEVRPKISEDEFNSGFLSLFK